jgi:hypothetical protein
MTILTEKFEPIIIDNCFTDEHMMSAYRTMALANHEVNNNTGEKDLVIADNQFGYLSYTKSPDKFILDRVMQIMKDNTDINIDTPEFHFAKYSLSSGYRPQLYPHYDTHLTVPHLTLSIQIGGTFPWPIFIDNKKYVLNDNQGLLFSGTHQIHWRQNIDFSDNDYNDVLLCQFKVKNSKNLSQDHIKYMEMKKEAFWYNWEQKD